MIFHMIHMKSLWPSWLFFKYVLILPAWVNNFLEEPHLKSLWFSWIIFMCLLSKTAWVSDFTQDLHLKSLQPSWTVLCDFLYD